MNVNNENKLQELSLYVNINLNNMNIQKQQNAKTYNKDTLRSSYLYKFNKLKLKKWKKLYKMQKIYTQKI